MIAIGTDHAGYKIKRDVINFLDSRGYEYKDFGCFSEKSCDYPDYALLACESVASGECDKAILICGTGVGISIVANKIKGIRAALCNDVFSAKATREHNNSNVIAMGERVVGVGHMLEILNAFLTTEFSQDERHIKRIDKIKQIENKYFK